MAASLGSVDTQLHNSIGLSQKEVIKTCVKTRHFSAQQLVPTAGKHKFGVLQSMKGRITTEQSRILIINI